MCGCVCSCLKVVRSLYFDLVVLKLFVLYILIFDEFQISLLIHAIWEQFSKMVAYLEKTEKIGNSKYEGLTKCTKQPKKRDELTNEMEVFYNCFLEGNKFIL